MTATRQRPHLRLVTEGGPAPALGDAELIAAFERGDLRTAEHLYDRLAHVVHATLVKILGQRGQDHDDLVQAAFEQILLTLSRRRLARACSLSSWAISVTTHVALNAIRSHQRERRSFELGGQVPDVARGSQPAPDQSSMMRALRLELAKLPERTATVIVLHEVMGHDLAEVTVLTGLSVAAAQSRLVRGRTELRRRLESQFPKGAS